MLLRGTDVMSLVLDVHVRVCGVRVWSVVSFARSSSFPVLQAQDAGGGCVDARQCPLLLLALSLRAAFQCCSWHVRRASECGCLLLL